ncbi:MAG: ATP-dependent 6-phosphofructokinase [Treponema sp.]|nr:ATP-dependent 6-phosphofructokinase [Treponema sp.]
MKTSIKTIGILTSGGDAPGLNAAIRAICISAKENYGAKVIGFKNGYRGLVENNFVKMSEFDMEALRSMGGTVLGTSREKPFKATEKNPVTGKMPVDSIKETFKKNKLDALICLGGNGTNSTASLLAKEGLPVIGLPKTIDNDVFGTDVTFGFDSAIELAAEGICQIRTTAKSMNRAMVVEIMGHKVGWLGLYAGAAAGADIILLPEIPYDIKVIAKHVKELRAKGRDYIIIAASEGALSAEEAKLGKKAFKKARASMTESVSYRIAREIEEVTGMETRTSVLGYTQRGVDPNAKDIILSTQFGAAAVEFAARKEFGVLIAMKDNKIVGYPLSEVEGKVKPIPMDDPVLKSQRALGVCFGD